MRTDNSAFSSVNKARNRELFFVVEIAFDLANTDLYYLTFSTVPGLSGANVIDGCLESISGTSQKVNPDKALSTIGTMTFSAGDQALTSLQKDKLAANKGLRGKRARFYVGGAGLDWTEYVLAQTQIIDSVDFKDAVYTFRCADIQRQMRTDIFDVKNTALTTTFADTDTVMNVYNTAEFAMVKHPAGLTHEAHAPGEERGYLKLTNGSDVEIIAWSGKTSTTFTGCERGVFGTKPLTIEVAGDTTADNAPKVEEYVYLELPAPMLAYAILTGSIYGEPGKYLPDHWHLGISTNYVKTSDFVNIGRDWWDTANAESGVVAVIKGQKKTDGKKFVEEQIYRMLGAFSPVYSTGELGLKRLSVVHSSGGYVAVLNEDNVIDYGDLTHDMKAVINKIAISWNWVETRQAYTRANILIDSNSIARHGESDPLELTLRCLESSRHSYNTLKNRFDSLRDRYAGPPLRLSLKLTPNMNELEVGDIVRVNLDAVKDYSGSTAGGELSRNFEVQQVATDWVSGEVSIVLFGSSQIAGALAPDEEGTPLSPGFFTSEGINIKSYLDAHYGVNAVCTSSGGITTITGNCTLPGHDDINNAAAIYYCNEDLTISGSGSVVVTTTKNVQIRVNGQLQINGAISSKGQGTSGAAGVSCVRKLPYGGVNVPNYDAERPTWQPAIRFFGASTSQPGFIYGSQGTYYFHGGYDENGGANSARGLNVASVPELNLSIANNKITGIPSDISGQPGSGGGAVWDTTHNASPGPDDREDGDLSHIADGGAGGAGGGGLLLISSGCDFGANGYIDSSGADGADGFPVVRGSRTFYSGKGAGGAPGAVYFILTKDNATRPDRTSATMRCYYGSSDASGYSTVVDAKNVFRGLWPLGAISAAADGRPFPDHTANVYAAATKVQYVTGLVAPVSDVPQNSSDVLFITLTEYTNTPPSQSANLSTVEVSVTGPSDPNYSHAWVQYKINLNDPWIDLGPVSPEGTYVVPSDGTKYYVRALSVSKSGVISPSGPIAEITVTNVIGNPDVTAPAVLTFDAITVYSEAGGATFTGKDAKFKWNDSNSLKSYFLNYRVQILDGSSNLMRTETTTDPFYVYTYEKNKEDYKAFHASDGANRDFSIRVTVLGRVEVTGGQYEGPTYTLAVSNPAPAAVGSLVISAGYGVIFVGGTNPTDLDFTQFAIHVSTTAGFTASAATLLGYATRLPITVAAKNAAGDKLDAGVTYYLRIESFDEFGAGGITTDYAALIPGIPAGTEIPVAEVLNVDGRIIADASGDPYRVTLGPHVTSSRASLFSFKNTTTGTPYFTLFEDGEVAINGKITIAAGSSGISSFSDAGALATADEIAYDEITGVKPPANATVGATWGSNILNQPTSLSAIDAHAANQLDKKSAFFFQAGLPMSPDTGDFWVDTADGNKVYHYDGLSWVNASDDRIVQAIIDAQDAKTTADGKAVVYFDDNAPYGASEGDLWKKPGGAVFRHDGSADWDINTLVSDGVYVSIGSGSATPSDCYVSPDGHHLFVLDSSGGLVNQSYLPTANSLVGRTFVGSFSVAAQEASANGLTFKPDGTKMYIVGSASDQVRQYSLTTDWTITSGVTLEKSIAAPGSFSSGLDISADGTKMLVADTNGVYMMSLPTAWDIEGATQSSVKFFSPLAIRNGRISPDANVLYLHSLNDDTVYQYSMPGGNIALATQTGLFYFGAAASHLGGCFSHDGLKYFNADNGNDRVNQFSVDSPWKQIATENNHYNQIATPTGFKGDTWYKTDSQEFYTHDGTAWNKSATVGATWGTDITGQPASSEILNSQQQWVQILGAPENLEELDAVAKTQLDNKSIIYYQNEPPAGTLHDCWIDLDDNRKIYWHDGTTWVAADDNRIIQAIDAAQDAQTTADGKAVVFFDTVEPVGATEGDLWKQTGGTKHLYRKNAGAGWSVVSTENKIFHQEAEPTGSLGDMWFKPSTQEFKQHNGSTWAYVSDVTGAKTALNTQNVGSSTAATVESGANKANAGLNSSGEVQKVINGSSIIAGIPKLGLNLTETHLGYHNGTTWKTWMENTGRFYLDGTAGNHLWWDGTTLEVRGDIQATSIAASAITGQVLTGATIRTSAGTKRVEMRYTDNSLTFWTPASTLLPRVTIDDATTSSGFIDIIGSAGKWGVSVSSCYVSFAGEASETGGSVLRGLSTGYAKGVDVTAASHHAISAVNNGSGAYYTITGVCTGSSVGVAGQCNGNIGVAGQGVTGCYGVGTTYDFYAAGAGTNYAPFTGSHDALILKASTQPMVGDIVMITGIAGRRNVSNILASVAQSTTAESKAAFGVVASSDDMPDYDDNEGIVSAIRISALNDLTETEYNALKADNYYLMVNGVGEGQINVCDDNGDIEVGDFISTSATPGKGQLYTGSDMRVVVAKALEPVDWSAETETTKMIACVYLCS